MEILSRINSPADLKALTAEEIATLVDEIRYFLVEKVSATGGHLGPNLGVVELSVAIHRVFESPHDPIIFDTSHQSYVHKILTGRAADFDTLRQKDGLSGYTCREESEHDWTESSHASAALSYGDGLAKAFQIKGEHDRNVAVVVGDGALTGGMCWEALNNIATGKDRNVVVIVNDNGRSYSPTIGGLAENLAGLRKIRTQPLYDRLMAQGKETLKSLGWLGERAFEALHAVKEGVKSTVIPTEMFSDLGMKYVGPVDGHDVGAVESALQYARAYHGPIIVHVVTEKGRGYLPAENDEAELMHATGVIDPKTGEPIGAKNPGWTQVFSKELLALGQEREDIVAITAAMSGPTGLAPFGEKYPERFFDVGIAEQHALTSAAGMALAGLHPVVALYSTFLNRAFDQLLMDVALLDLPVTLVLDRAGVTGSDGASHNGVWDFAIAGLIPRVRVAAPRDGAQLKVLFREAVTVPAPTIVRFPKGDLPQEIPAIEVLSDGAEIIHSSCHDDKKNAESKETSPAILIVAIGAMATNVMAVCSELAHSGLNITVVDPRWVIPVSTDLVSFAQQYDLIVTVEDAMLHGGVGSLFAQALAEANSDIPVRHLAFPQFFPLHASRNELLKQVGLDAPGIAESIKKWADEMK
ncbi:1-deoxy-D-xylulose-5-phosphate synthase [Corynebacterium sp. sy017]|uniref:1-deoxy-D-xylulose-5-phosphate synthase n=1 Tax=unclassified Corynebacterium TaxID=2624378 RepID=UPI001186F38C|nr:MULTISPECIES: 1-deoxy-D-xylulose-5-phosphate synthase [unclassified Corynebacterium]MBP3087747.1 1-deoxy-D-xylulose-5-phosphate synthase [Corynebacterium sp. sy017]TSD92298.1 1-deoxy-D-xylulose-5-phosphate synthase [Corynebacterium sp. SY003]